MNLIYLGMKESQGNITLEDDTPEVINLLLSYIYTPRDTEGAIHENFESQTSFGLRSRKLNSENVFKDMWNRTSNWKCLDNVVELLISLRITADKYQTMTIIPFIEYDIIHSFFLYEHLVKIKR
jgi:hypothetical protein